MGEDVAADWNVTRTVHCSIDPSHHLVAEDDGHAGEEVLSTWLQRMTATLGAEVDC